jgi:putative glutamine amidotransferase
MKTDMILGYSCYNAPRGGMGPLAKLFTHPLNISRFSEIQLCDAVVLWGGSDISPSLYNEPAIRMSGPDDPSQRDLFEAAIIKEAIKHSIPIIGICRGAQLMCALAGGSLIQDVSGHNSANHAVMTYDGKEFKATSAHHQMMYPFDIEHKVLAWSKEKLSRHYHPPIKEIKMRESPELECVYFPTINGLGIQSHPEWEHKNSEYNDWFMNQICVHCFKEEVSC